MSLSKKYGIKSSIVFKDLARHTFKNTHWLAFVFALCATNYQVAVVVVVVSKNIPRWDTFLSRPSKNGQM